MELRMKRRMQRGIMALLVALGLLSAPVSALADEHDPQSSAHPLEIIGTLLYPVGWLVDTVVVRPLHWVAHLGPVSTITGHENDLASEADDD